MILKHLDLWDVRLKPPPRAYSPPTVFHFIFFYLDIITLGWAVEEHVELVRQEIRDDV